MKGSSIRKTLVALAAVLMLSALTPMAGQASASKLVLNRSMAGVKLGASVHRLHQILGHPKAVKVKSNEITGHMRVDYYGRLSFSSYSGSILGMKTTRRSIRTRSGIGVGTTKRRLKRAFPGLDCYGASCLIVAGGGVATIGRRTTGFRVRHGKVKIVSVGRVID